MSETQTMGLGLIMRFKEKKKKFRKAIPQTLQAPTVSQSQKTAFES